jgi:hypothetical protein
LLIKIRNKEQNGKFSKLENPIALGMGIVTEPNFIDALPNNHGLILPNKKWREQLAFQWIFSMTGACIRGWGSAEYMSPYST